MKERTLLPLETSHNTTIIHKNTKPPTLENIYIIHIHVLLNPEQQVRKKKTHNIILFVALAREKKNKDRSLFK